MNFNQNDITPADGEQLVRTYCCTSYKPRQLGIQSNGYLSVTNKRVIYQAQGTHNGFRSVIQSEVPIADISGISSYKGIYFGLLYFLAALLLTSVLSSVSTALLSAIMYAVYDYDLFIAIAWCVVAASFAGSFLVGIQSIWRTVLAGVSVSALMMLGGGSLISSLMPFGGYGNRGGWQIFLAAIVLIYSVVCAYWYARRPTFSLEINSKGGASTPISISSAGGIFSAGAGKSIGAEPAKDADQMLKELGAVILDIQILGDFGISKWTVQDNGEN